MTACDAERKKPALLGRFFAFLCRFQFVFQLPHDTAVVIDPAIQRKQLLRDQLTAVTHQPSPLLTVAQDPTLVELESQKGQYTHQMIHGDLLYRVVRRCS